MEKRFSATNARRRLGAVMSLAAGGDPVIIEKSGAPVAAVVPIQWYLTRMAEREARFAALEASIASRPVYPDEVVEADIAEAVSAVRAGRRLEDGQQAGITFGTAPDIPPRAAGFSISRHKRLAEHGTCLPPRRGTRGGGQTA